MIKAVGATETCQNQNSWLAERNTVEVRAVTGLNNFLEKNHTVKRGKGY